MGFGYNVLLGLGSMVFILLVLTPKYEWRDILAGGGDLKGGGSRKKPERFSNLAIVLLIGFLLFIGQSLFLTSKVV